MKYHTILFLCSFILCFIPQWSEANADSTTIADRTDLSWKEKLQSIQLHMPLDIQLYLAGNFCELRSNHFHGGIDIKTQGRSGLKVYTCDDGYISRVKVSPYGYGRALYIHHPKTGLTSVYAHLQKFTPELDKYIRNLQYEQRKFALDISLDANQFEVKKGEQIAFSGNTGGSQAPHLHFELRESKNQKPVNPLYYPFDIKDHRSPEINGLVFYGLSPKNKFNIVEHHPVKLIKKGNHYTVKDTVEVPLLTSFGIKTYDRSDGMQNLNGVYAIQMKLDSIDFFSFEMNQFSFTESKYINSFIDYELYKEDKGRFIKCFVEPLNKLSIYPQVKDNGILQLEDGKSYEVHFLVTDNHGNKSYLDFTIKANTAQTCIPDPTEFSATCGLVNNFQHEGAKLNLPKKALYSNEYIHLERLEELEGAVSSTYQIHFPTTPLHQKATLSIPLKSGLSQQEVDNVCLVELKKNGKINAIDSKATRFSVEGKIRSFGQYTAYIDSIAPVIELVNISQNKDMSLNRSIRVKAIDKMSGIENFEGFIDGEWVLMEYDAKNDLFIHTFEKAANGTKHLFEFHVKDKRNNKSVLKINYTR